MSNKPMTRIYFTGDGINRAYNLEYVPVTILEVLEGDEWVHYYTIYDGFLIRDMTNRREYKGGYAIVGNQIVFEEAPAGPFWVDYLFKPEEQ